MKTKNKKSVSIIIPCFNEELVIAKTFQAINDELKKNKNPSIDFNFIFVDDGSIDSTVDIIKKFPKADVQLIRLSRNFGHQSAVLAGIDHCPSDAAIIMDADLQDPPSVIKKMIDKYQEGYDVVYAVRKSRRGETYFKKMTAYLFYRCLNFLSDFKIPQDVGDFRLISSNIISEIKKSNEYEPYLRGIISWVGFRQIGVEYERDKRAAGETKYPLKKMLALAISGITSFSAKPLRCVSLLGLITLCLAFLTLVYILYMRFFTNSWLIGWTAIMFSILFLGSIQLIAIGVIGEYISKIHFQVKNRPNYIKLDDDDIS